MKLITNDASKNADNKEIARLKMVSLHTFLDYTVQAHPGNKINSLDSQ